MGGRTNLNRYRGMAAFVSVCLARKIIDNFVKQARDAAMG